MKFLLKFNPLENPTVVGVIEEEKAKDVLTISEFVKLGHPLNPSRNTQSWITTIDQGDLVVFEDSLRFKKFKEGDRTHTRINRRKSVPQRVVDNA